MHSGRRRFGTDFVGFVAALILAIGGALSAPVLAQDPGQPQAYAIEGGDLADALDRFAEQNRLQIIYNPDLISGRSTPEISGAHAPEEVLQMLLAGTGLEWEFVNDKTVVVRNPKKARGADAAVAASAADVQFLEVEGTPVAASPADTQGTTAASVEAARRDGIEEIIVTGQKKEERLQDVPIAISAFSMEKLDAQKIEGGFDLLKAVPNVTFSKSNFTGYNFQIRGIGTQAISATTDPGVAVSFNNTTLIVNRLFEQEYLDIERVEVLRGPQGTLFGRNATAGVINVISAKPELGISSGELKTELGNYNALRFRGHVNTPLFSRDDLALRAAFAVTKRDGYGKNLAYSDPEIQDFISRNNREPVSSDIDNRDLWTGRISLGWQASEGLRTNLIYERFEEDDRRMRSAKQLCHHADGNILLYDAAMEGNPIHARDAIAAGESERLIRTNYLSQITQGCLPKSLYDKGDPTTGSFGAYGTPNGNSIPFIRAGRGTQFVVGNAPYPHDPSCTDNTDRLVSGCSPDPLATPHGQSRDMRAIFSLIDPIYRATSEITEFSADFSLTDDLTLTSQTVYNYNELFSTQDFLRFKTSPIFNDSRNATTTSGNDIRHRQRVTPFGVFTDNQLGASDRVLMQDVSQLTSRQFSQEFRLTSDFDGAVNFSVGANYTRFRTVTDYFVFINMLSALVYSSNVYSGVPRAHPAYGITDVGLWATPEPNDMALGCATYMAQVTYDHNNNPLATCIYVQDGSIEDVANNPEGHNFFLSRNPYDLQSSSVFGEVYVHATEQLKITAGIRANWDRKTFTPVPSQTLLADYRGRLTGGTVFDLPGSLPAGFDIVSACHPQSPTKIVFVIGQVPCALSGIAPYGRGYPHLPDIVQEWRVPTGRLGLDWKPDLSSAWLDELLVYGFYTRGYKAGGANPPVQSAPSGLLLQAAQGVAAPPVFKAEYVNAVEIGTKGRAFGRAVSFGASAFVYDYSDYQISKIVDRTAVNENVDATVWGVELEMTVSPTVNSLVNASVGYLRTRIAEGEESLDLMDRVQGGNNHYVDPTWASVDCAQPGNVSHIACLKDAAGNYLYRDGFDQWVVVRPTLTQASSCVAPAVLILKDFQSFGGSSGTMPGDRLSSYCPGGRLVAPPSLLQGYSPFTSAPNSAAGFLADVGGNELPNAPRLTFSLGAQQTVWLPLQDWSATARADFYWQEKSFHRIYNTEYDRLKAWSSTNLSFWVSNESLGLTLEAYVKNIFNETPVTGAFLGSDDTGLATNVFTLDPRLIGVSIRKKF